jgi:hypothetical protein
LIFRPVGSLSGNENNPALSINLDSLDRHACSNCCFVCAGNVPLFEGAGSASQFLVLDGLPSLWVGHSLDDWQRCFNVFLSITVGRAGFSFLLQMLKYSVEWLGWHQNPSSPSRGER